MQTKEKIPILAVVGPTASGKTALGVELAKAYNGEVVSADSMQIYKGMDIATAKPTPEEMQGIPHHLIDILPRDTIFNVADYVKLAEQAIAGKAADSGRWNRAVSCMAAGQCAVCRNQTGCCPAERADRLRRNTRNGSPARAIESS